MSCACTLSDAFRAAAGSKSGGYEEKKLEMDDKNPFTADLMKDAEPSMPSNAAPMPSNAAPVSSNAAPNPFESEASVEPEKPWQPLDSESESSLEKPPKT